MKCKLPGCDNEIKLKGRLYCSKECSRIGQVASRSLIMSEIKEKRKATNLERYGVENTGQSAVLREKYEATCLKKYGKKNPLSVAHIRESAKKTCLEKYGNEYSTRNNDVKQKIKFTNLERYGFEFASMNEEIKKKTQETNLQKYGYLYHTQKHISHESISVCKDKDLLFEYHHKKLKPIYIIAEELGISKSQLGKIYKNYEIDILHFKKSQEEIELLHFVKSIIDLDVESNVRGVIGTRELDIFIPDKNLAIEYNGTYWHSEISGGKSKNYHNSKTIEALKNNINLIHIFDYEWKFKKEIIKSIIISLLGKSARIYARNCILKEVPLNEEKLFLEINHLQGYSSSSICYGLYHNNELVSIMSFSKPRYNKKYKWELLRFANKLGTNVVGGASKLFSHFKKLNKGSSVISYSHRDKFTGDIYKKLGFNFSHSTAPAPYYTNDYINVENRIRYQKHKLSKIFKNFDPNLSEWINMKNNGYDRIWDCGNDVWIQGI